MQLVLYRSVYHYVSKKNSIKTLNIRIFFVVFYLWEQYVYVYTCVHADAYLCHMHVEAREQLQIFIRTACFLRQGLSLTWDLLIW